VLCWVRPPLHLAKQLHRKIELPYIFEADNRSAPKLSSFNIHFLFRISLQREFKFASLAEHRYPHEHCYKHSFLPFRWLSFGLPYLVN